MKFFLLVILFYLVSPSFSLSQETQVPIDINNKIELIDQELENKLRLFQEYQGFREARLFRINDTLYVLEISYEVDNRLSRKRINMTALETQEFRTQVTKKIKTEHPRVILNQEGRKRMLIGDITLGLCAYGWLVPASLEVEDGKTAVALYLITSAGCYFVPYLLTEDQPVSNAAATLNNWGGIAGMGHGALLYNLLGGEEATGYFGAMTITGIVESVAGYLIAKNTNMEAGKADIISAIGTYGFGYGLGISVLADIDFEKNFEAVFALMLLGSGAGIYAGNWIANTQYYTQGDAFVLNNSAALGVLIPLSVIAISEIDDKYIVSSLLMGGTSLGIWLGDILVRDKNFTEDQGSYITYGTLGGFLLGAGLGYIVSGNNFDPDYKSIPTLSTIGAGIGFAIMYNSFNDKAKIPDDKMGSLDFNFSPIGLTSYFMTRKSLSESLINIPIFSLSYKF